MKNPTALAAALAAISISSASAAPLEGPLWLAGEDASVVSLCSTSFYDDWIADRLTIGLRISSNRLTDGKRPANYEEDFLGAIYHLDNANDTIVWPEVRYWAVRYVRLSFGWNSVAGRTRNFNTPNHHSDGKATLKGPVFMAEAVYPMLDDTLFLYAGGGFMYGRGGFGHVTWWHLGYSDEESWRSVGAPKNERRGRYYRQINVENEWGTVLSCGVAWRPVDRFELDFSVRKIWIEPDCSWGYARGNDFDEQQSNVFTLDHLQFGMTLSYVF